MKKQKGNLSNASLLLQEAEELVKMRTDKAHLSSNPVKEADLLKLINCIELLQIELEKQNKELVIAKEKAQFAEEKYSELYDFAPSGYFTLSAKGEILELNLIGAMMLGKERAQLHNCLFCFFVSDETKPVFKRFLEKAFKSMTKVTCKLTLQVTDRLSTHVILEGICHKNGLQCKLTATDITERKQTEEALQDSEEQLKAIFENSLNPIIIADDAGNYLKVNQAAAMMFNYPIEKLLQMNVGDLQTTSSPDAAKLYQEYLNKGYEIGEFDFIRPDKSQAIAQYHAVRVRENFNLSILSDITERKQAELVIRQKTEEIEAQNKELIIAKEHAEENDRLKSAFLANMSHEIRTPMNGILGFADLLKEPNLTGDEQQQYIDIIEKSGVRMLNIINDIIDISKIEAGLMKLEIQESKINEQIEYIYTFFKPEAEAKGLRLSFNTPLSAKEATIKTDREKLYAILTNLVKNAIKYNSKGGAIEIGYTKTDKFLEFYIKDTGIGISKDKQETVFERFIQVDIENKMARQGAGLGLAISKAYVTMLGGKIWVESEMGKGSTFYFTLPFNVIKKKNFEDENLKTLAFESEQSNKNYDLKILIVEDDVISEMVLSKIAEQFSKEIIVVRNGLKAVDTCLNNSDIDLIMMDIHMPDLNGYEATRQIRQFNKDVIIIAQTALGLTGDREKAIEAGCSDYISKPIKRLELLELIQKFFGR